jgi:glycosyltransferase involved in cell wall biosynthesis
MKNELTVCLITFNHAKYIESALDSILIQKASFEWNLTIFDDHSSDGTTEILRKYKNTFPDKITLHVQPHNVGMHENWRKMLLSVTSNYIALIDGDDYWIDDRKLEKQLSYLKENSSVGLIYSSALQIHQENGCARIIGEKTNRKLQFLKNSIITSTVIFKRECLNGYFDTLEKKLPNWSMCDYPLWLWVSRKYNIHFMREPMTAYRVLQTSATRTSSKLRWIRSKIEIINYFYKSKNDDAVIYYIYGGLMLRIELFYKMIKYRKHLKSEKGLEK